LSDEFEKLGILSPLSIGSSPISLNIYVDDPDAVFASMLKDAAIELSPMKDQFHGDRSGKLQDRYGHIWHIARNQEDLTSDEIIQKFSQAMDR
jgi:PhnB protein